MLPLLLMKQVTASLYGIDEVNHRVATASFSLLTRGCFFFFPFRWSVGCYRLGEFIGF